MPDLDCISHSTRQRTIDEIVSLSWYENSWKRVTKLASGNDLVHLSTDTHSVMVSVTGMLQGQALSTTHWPTTSMSSVRQGRTLDMLVTQQNGLYQCDDPLLSDVLLHSQPMFLPQPLSTEVLRISPASPTHLTALLGLCLMRS